ncbi:MAG TPA: NAD-dependent epimerase/dehydratase family protein [Polyangia bacterium]|jgi:dTDP-L-rhamnose 4-epimerase
MTGRVLITGGAGFIGSRLARRLHEAGQQVRILDALVPQVHGASPQLPDWLTASGEVRVGDVRDRDVVAAALDDVVAVVHLAAETGPAQSMYEIERYVGANVQGTAVVLQAVLERRDRVRRLVVASSRAVYGEGKYLCAACGPVVPDQRRDERLKAGQWDPTCPRCGGALTPVATDEECAPKPTSIYAVTKLAQEQMAVAFGRAYGIPTAALRYQNVYGGGQSLTNPYVGVLAIFTARIKSGKGLQVYEDGRIQRDFVHVDDVVAATQLALTAPLADAHVLNVGSGRPVSIHEVANELCRTLGARDVAIDVTGQYRAGDIRHCYADLTQAGRVLGYAPQVSLAGGLRELCAAAEHAPIADKLDDASAELTRLGLLR